MPWLPRKQKAWPENVGTLPEDKIVEMYAQGFCGAKFDQAAEDSLDQTILDGGGNLNGEDVAHSMGFAGSGAGKLILPFVGVLKFYPTCWPGPAQQRGDCVSWGCKNAALLSLMGDAIGETPDEVTGLTEGMPEVSEDAMRNGVLSTEYAYWWRGYSGDGWQCPTAAEVAVKRGMMLRQAYPELGIDLTKYTGALAGKYGRSAPPDNIEAVGKQHRIHTATRLKDPDACRDFLYNLYGIIGCSGITGRRRDENGHAPVEGIGGHSEAFIGYDDRDAIKKIYGEPLILRCNSHGANATKGGTRIYGTDIDIPANCYWFKVSALKRVELVGLSGGIGWAPREMPDWGKSEFTW